MPLLIKNGRLITPADDYHADLYCAGPVITRIDAAIDPASCAPGTKVIDAAGKFVFPGFIDPHVHIYLPFMGTYAKDTWESAGRAALIGGTTSLIEMICPAKTDEPLAAFETWLAKASGIAPCDYTFHMGVTRYDDLAETQLREIVKHGIRSFKVFLAYKGALGVDDRELYRTLKLARELGIIVTAHCENETLIAERQAELLAAGNTGPAWHEPSRPVQVEAEGVHHLITFAELTGAEVYIVHTSCDEAVNEALCGISRGVRAHIEVVLPHLILDKTYAERGAPSATGGAGVPPAASMGGAGVPPAASMGGAGVPPASSDPFSAAKYIMSPPLRDQHQQARLWNHLRSRAISTVATDHAPFDFETQKSMGRDDFTRIPNGIPSVEDRVNLLYTHGVCTGRINLHTFVDAASSRAARIFGLKGKGTIAVGADADLVVYDPAYRGRISAKTHHMATDYSAFEGWEIKGRPAAVTVRGIIMARDGQFVGPPGHGRLIPRA